MRTHKPRTNTTKRLSNIIGVGTILFAIANLFRFVFNSDQTPKLKIEPVCPIPNGSYQETCANYTSSLAMDDSQCDFSTICETGHGKNFGPHAVGNYKYNRYGDTCPPSKMIKHEFALPKATLFRFFNDRGSLVQFLNLHPIKEHKTSEYDDVDCKIRKQLNAASKEDGSLVAATVVGFATARLMI